MPRSGPAPSSSGRRKPRPRTSLPEGSMSTPGAAGSQVWITANMVIACDAPDLDMTASYGDIRGLFMRLPSPGAGSARAFASWHCWRAIAYVILVLQRTDRPAERMIRLEVAIAAGEGRTRGIRERFDGHSQRGPP